MSLNVEKLAYCGIYCELCSFKAAWEEQSVKHLEAVPFKLSKVTQEGQIDLSVFNCECCKGYCICGPCHIKDCASRKEIQSCADCNEFPCEHIEHFANDGMPHHRTAIKNLKSIRKNGIEEWFEGLEPTLRCQCGERQTWYYTCPQHR